MSDYCSSSPFPSTDCPIHVLKFGGTSVGTVDTLRSAVRVVQQAADRCRPVVVVSAAAGVTDCLVRAAEAAPHSPAAAATWGERVGDRYRTLAEGAIGDASLRTRYESCLQARLSVLGRALTDPVPKASPGRDAVLAVGERLMAPLLVGALADVGPRAQVVDAASLIRTDASHGAAAVDWPDTRTQIRAWCARWGEEIPIVTGFIGSTAEGATTTLGRGGSDYSAALLARGLGAERLERWTDVDALYTCDPTEHDEARRLSQVQMETARAWARDGRLGLHAQTLDPLAAADIPLHVRCTHRPEAPGTRVIPTGSEIPC